MSTAATYKQVDVNIYKDPDNWEEILETIKKTPTLGEIYALLNTTFPNIVVGFMDGFSPDYPHLTENWEKIAKENNVKTTQVMILDNFSYDDNHKLLMHFCECFTRAGFSVKRKMEFVPCPKTNLAIPTELLHDYYKSDSRITPEKYAYSSSNS